MAQLTSYVLSLFLWGVMLSAPAAMITHWVTCVGDQAWGLLVAGTVAFPVGVIHGWGIWMGYF